MTTIVIVEDETFCDEAYLDALTFTDFIKLASKNKFAREYADRKNLRGVPIKEQFSLYDYQVEAINWMKNREATPHRDIRGGIVCMEMGMGKTLVGLTHTLSSPKGPTLIIASKTVMIEWKTNGIDKFLDNVNVLYMHPDFMSKVEIADLTEEKVKQYDIVITTYDVCMSACKNTAFYEDCFEYGDVHTMLKGKIVTVNIRKTISAAHRKATGTGTLYSVSWERVICDESQRFANHNTKLYYCMMAICAKYRWCLSGTPIRNYETDIWAQLRFCGYRTIDRAIEWSRHGRVQFAAENLNTVVYNVKYTDVGIQLTEKTERDEIVTMTQQQKKAYTKFLDDAKAVYKNVVEGKKDFAEIIASFVRLRQCAIAPYLVCKESKRNPSQSDSRTNLEYKLKDSVLGIYCPKILRIIEILKGIPSDDKVCFFTTFTSYSDLLASALDSTEFKYLQLDGDTSGPDRNSVLDKFRNDSSIKILLLTYRVGGEGLNLVEANHCIFGEPWWTNSVLRQAKARVWRTGQTKPVFVYNIITTDTIEDRILEICKEKDDMTNEYLQSSGGLTKVMLGRILKLC